MPADAVNTRVTYTIFRSLLFRKPSHSEFHKWAEKALHLFQQSSDILFRMEFIFHIVFYCHLSGDFRSFTTTMNRLRSLIGSKAVQSRGKSITLDPNHCWVDVWAFEHLLADIEKSNPAAPDFWHHIEKILTLYQGHFIEGEDRLSGVTFYRDRLWSKFLSKIHKIGLKLEKTGEYEKAVALYQKGLEADPLSEELYRYLMVCYSLMNRQAEIKKTYERCKIALITALKVEPSIETEKLLRNLLAR